LTAHPRRIDIRDPYAVDAETRQADGAVVELQIHPESLGPATWAALPSLLVHECVCHAPARQGGKVKNTSLFAEAFMHWAARWLFVQWITVAAPEFAATASQHASGLWEILTPAFSDAGGSRARGWRAAEETTVWAVEHE